MGKLHQSVRFRYPNRLAAGRLVGPVQAKSANEPYQLFLKA
jgi:hypothetical protein